MITEKQKIRFLHLMRAKLLLVIFIRSEKKVVICDEFLRFYNRETNKGITTISGLSLIEKYFPELYEKYIGAGAWLETNEERLINIKKVIKVLEEKRTTPNV